MFLPRAYLTFAHIFGLSLCIVEMFRHDQRRLGQNPHNAMEQMLGFDRYLYSGRKGERVTFQYRYIPHGKLFPSWIYNMKPLTEFLGEYEITNGTIIYKNQKMISFQNLTLKNVTFYSQGLYGCHLANGTMSYPLDNIAFRVEGVGFGLLKMQFKSEAMKPELTGLEQTFTEDLSLKVYEAIEGFRIPRFTPVVMERTIGDKELTTVAIYQSLPKNNSYWRLKFCNFWWSTFRPSNLNLKNYTLISQEYISYDCCKPEKTKFTWPLTEVGHTAVVHCKTKNQTNQNATASRHCLVGEDGSHWSVDVKNKNCESKKKKEVQEKLKALEKVPVTDSNAKAVGSSLKNLTSSAKSFQREEFTTSVKIFGSVVDVGVPDLELSKGLLKTANNVLNTPSGVIAEAQLQNKSSSNLLRDLEKVMDLIPILGSDTVVIEEDNLSLMTKQLKGDLSSSVFIGSTPNGTLGILEVNSEDDIESGSFGVLLKASHIRSSMKTKGPKSTRLSGYLFENTKLFSKLNNTSPVVDFNVSLNRVVSAVLHGKVLKDTKEPILIFLRRDKQSVATNDVCAFWNSTENGGYGLWSTVGCSPTPRSTKDVVVCQCNHLTNFALLVSPQPVTVPSIHTKILSVISYVGCIISSVCIAFTVLTVAVTRHLRKARAPKILICLCISLLCTLLIFVIGAEKSRSQLTCRVIALFIHYFLLATFMWSAVEGINLYMALVKVLGMHSSRFILKASAFAWGVPLIIVFISGMLRYEKDYGAHDFCVVSGPTLIYAWLTPAAIVIAFNFVMLVMVMKSLRNSNALKAKDTNVGVGTQAKICFSCAFLMGLCWIFGIVSVEDARIVFQYIFSVLCAFQGMFIFIFKCAINKDIQKEWIGWFNMFSRRRLVSVSTFGTKTTGKPSMLNSTTQDQKINIQQSTSSLPLTGVAEEHVK